MKGMLRGLMVTGVLAGLVMGVNVGRVDARPKYKTTFEGAYAKVKEANKIDCLVCHEGSDKKNRNNYGQALAKNVAKNEMDEAKIKEAFTKTEAEKSAVKDKTFGDLLKDGKLPASK